MNDRMGFVSAMDQVTDDDTRQMIPVVDLPPGTRIRITAKPIGVTISRPTGVIIGASEWEGYYVVRLDAPAIYHNADGIDEPIDEIIEAFDNFTVLPDEQ